MMEGGSPVNIAAIFDWKFFKIKDIDEKGNAKGICSICATPKTMSGNFKAIGNFKLHVSNF